MEEQNIPLENSLQPGIELLNERVMRIKREIGKAVVGQENTIDLLLAGIFTGGHILLEGVPGIAKTLTAKLVAKSLSVNFSRIQFTPELLTFVYCYPGTEPYWEIANNSHGKVLGELAEGINSRKAKSAFDMADDINVRKH